MSRTRRFAQLPTLSLVGLLLTGSSCSQSTDGPNVLLVVIDTLRADRVSSYGYPRVTTPRLDALAAQGIRFENAYSTSSWTLPAHASIFTGRFPIEHGATQEHPRVDGDLPTLAEHFAKRNYATIGISGNGMVNRNSGLTRGFQRFVETWRGPSAGRQLPPDRHPNVVAMRESLQQLGPDQHFFAFVNFIEVHGPYVPPAPYRERFLSPTRSRSLVESAISRKAPGYYLDPTSISAAEFEVLSELYDGEVAYADALVGELIDAIEAAGMLDDTLVVITSDHGDNIGDHGHFRHVFSLYNTTVRVPLLVRLPGAQRAGEVRSEPVSLVDLFPTLLRAAGIDPGDSELRARDFLATGEIGDVPIFAEYYFPLQVLEMFDEATRTGPSAALTPYMRRLRSVQQDGWRFIWSSDGRHELYRIDRDAGERVDRSRDPTASDRLLKMQQAIAQYVERGGGAPPLPQTAARLVETGVFENLDAAARKHLQELGYLPE